MVAEHGRYNWPREPACGSRAQPGWRVVVEHYDISTVIVTAQCNNSITKTVTNKHWSRVAGYTQTCTFLGHANNNDNDQY